MMLMAMQELVAVVPPPAAPVETRPVGRKNEIEKALGIVLPEDLYELGLHYGSGRFADELEVFNAFSTKYLEKVDMVNGCYRQLKQGEGDDFVPYDIFPKSPGLFPWGVTTSGHVMFWLTEGEPNSWRTVLLRTGEMEFEAVQTQMTTFLADVFKGPMPCVLWEVEWQMENLVGKPFHSFQPDEL
jgi:hypothetical protein